jgi:hypothetical protein
MHQLKIGKLDEMNAPPGGDRKDSNQRGVHSKV